MKRFAVAGLVLVAGCPHRGDADLRGLLEKHPQGHVAGTITGLSVAATLNRQDFVYDLQVSPASDRAAFVHLASKVYRLSLWQQSPDLLTGDKAPVSLADAEINTNELDVLSIAFSPDGKRVATASRDRHVRVFDEKGAVLATYPAEEPQISVAWSPDGRFVVSGSPTGLVTVLSADALEYQSELRGHTEAVTSLAFDASGTLWSGGWDKVARSYALAPQAVQVTEARMKSQKADGLTGLRAVVNGRDSALLAIDERSDLVMLTLEAAKGAGIDVSFLKDHVTQPTPAGQMELPLAKDQSITFKGLVVGHVDVAVCKACVPAGADGVLGKSFLRTHPMSVDAATQEVVVRAPPEEATARHVGVLTPATHLDLPGFIQDLSVDRAGDRLGVALGEEKAMRNLALYEREKHGDDEPIVLGNVAAIVDAKTGKLVEKHNIQHGIVSTAGISPDGQSLASGGWDRDVHVFSQGKDLPVWSHTYGWSVRRVRFSQDGRLLGVAAWTPQNAQGRDGDPSAQLLRVNYASPKVQDAPRH